MRRYTRTAVATAGLLAAAAGCSPDLTAPNLNDPNTELALSSAADVQNLIGNSFALWSNSMNTVELMGVPVSADEMTSSFGNYGMRFNAQEPRIPYANIPGGGDQNMTLTHWTQSYGAMGNAIDGLQAIAGGLVITNQATTDQYKAFAKLVQGLSHANLAMSYDKAIVVPETYVPGEGEPPPLVTFPEVRTAALAMLDEAIAMTNGQTWVMPISYVSTFGGANGATAARVGQLANSYAARLLMQSARNGAQNAQTDWARVLAYAEKGITADAFVTSTTDNNFGSAFLRDANTHDWLRVDMRTMRLMDTVTAPGNVLPDRWTNQSAPPRKIQTADQRFGLNKDFIYMPDSIINRTTTRPQGTPVGVPFDVARGVYFFSDYAWGRYKAFARNMPNSGLGPIPIMLKAENDLMIAEALLRTGGDKARAATLINNSRVVRGGLPALTGGESTEELMDKLMYERTFELYGFVFVGWPDRRRMERLQPGSIRSLPVPARELQTLQLPIYTFGGVGQPDGADPAP